MDLLQDYLTEEFIRFNNAHLEKGVADSTEIIELKRKVDAANMECVKLTRRSKDRKAQNDELQATIKSMADSHNETLVLLESKEQEIKDLRDKVTALQKEKIAIAKLPFVQLSALADNSERKASELEGQLQKVSVSSSRSMISILDDVDDYGALLACYLRSYVKLEIALQSSIKKMKNCLHLRRLLFEARLSLLRVGSSKAK